MRKKKIIGIVLAAVLVAAGLGGFAYATNNGHASMTGQKLVGTGSCLVDGDIFFEQVFTFTNPDCVSEITIKQVSIIAHDGTVIHEGQLLDPEGNPLPQTLGPHEGGIIALRHYVARYYGKDIWQVREFPRAGYTVEIFWTCADKEGLPLTGWSGTVLLELEAGGNAIIGTAAGWSTQMVNMEQVLKPPKPKKVYNIGITQILTHPDLDATRQGFIDQMAEEGFIEGVNVNYDFRNPEGDPTEATLIAQKFVSEKVDLILSITTPSSQACVEAAKDTDIPVVFAAVTDPVGAGIVSTWDAPRPDNVTGVSDFPDIKAQMELIKEILPGAEDIVPDATVLGVIYNPGEFNSVLQINELKDIMADVGIDWLVEAHCWTTDEVAAAANSLVGKCDAIWIPTDDTVASGLEAVIVVGEENQIPVFGSTVETVERGCIATLGVDYTWEGEQAGRYAARILRGEFAGDIPVVKCPGEVLVLVVNPGAAERMGVTIPEEVLQRADRIVGE